MIDAQEKTEPKKPGELIREFRGKQSLDQFADRFEQAGFQRPSIAKLSRIETGIQPVPLDLLPAIGSITGIPPEELRPDVASKFARVG
jgi:transcriptional regulator with XRE-family HTH domain